MSDVVNPSTVLRIEGTISENPRHHPGCCLGLSTTLIKTLSSLLPSAPRNTLSIGSGSGLLEAYIHDSHSFKPVYGVEVSREVNKHLPEEFMHIVPGTHSLCEAAEEAAVWLFVYPRETSLVRSYLEAFGSGEVRRIIWLGPVVDWEDYEAIFIELMWKIRLLPDCGLLPYETMAVMERAEKRENTKGDKTSQDDLDIEAI